MEATLFDGSIVSYDEKPFATGGAGHVHAAQDSRHVIKLFKQPPANLLRSLQYIVEEYKNVGADPEWAPFFCWPTDIVLQPKLGVRLPRLTNTCVELAWLINPKALDTKPVQWHSWQLRLSVALSLTMAMTRLHGEGLAHSDLSPRNVWFDPRTGAVTLIDIDGLVVPKVNPPQVLGTPDYIAPEIVLDPLIPPSIRSDRHSLAVLLYQLLLYRHPLHGPRVAPTDRVDDERHALGPDGVYIDHPSDHCNRPTAGMWDSFWPSFLLGPQLASLYERSFVAGLRDPTARPLAGEWLGALTRLADRVIACSNSKCREQYFPITDGVEGVCPWCRTQLVLAGDTPILHLYPSNPAGNYYAPEANVPWWIVAAPGRKLHEWHVSKGVNASPRGLADAPLAEIEHTKGVWNLRNRRLDGLAVVRDGAAQRIALNEHVRLDEGTCLVLAAPPRGRGLVVGGFAQ